MVLRLQTSAQIKEVLKKNPQGLSITDIVREVHVNRNTVGRYLEKLLISGQVEMRHFGMAKIYALANRVPVSAVLSISSELDPAAGQQHPDRFYQRCICAFPCHPSRRPCREKYRVFAAGYCI